MFPATGGSDKRRLNKMSLLMQNVEYFELFFHYSTDKNVRHVLHLIVVSL